MGEKERERVRKLELVTAQSDQRSMGTHELKKRQSAANRNRPLAWTVLCLFLSVMGLGCQFPRYQFPKGYSSTYSRILHAKEFAAPPSAETPPVDSLSQSPGVFYPQTFKYQPPTRSEFQRTVTVLPEDRPTDLRRY